MQPHVQPSNRQLRPLPPSVIAFPKDGVRAKKRDWTDEVDFTDNEEACKFLQRELVATKRKWADIAREAGCCGQTVSKVAYGETKSPRLQTTIRLLRVMGFTLTAWR